MINLLLYSGSKAAEYFFIDTFHNHTNIKIFTLNKNILTNIKNLLRSDIIQIISSDLRGLNGILWIFLYILFKLLRKPTILYWIGTDVSVANKTILHICSNLITQHIAQSSWLVEELKQIGITATQMTIPSPTPISITPLPNALTILTYLGMTVTSDFYGGQIIQKLINTLPYKFLILGQTKFNDLPNVTYLGTIDMNLMDTIYKDVSVLLRLTKHDGLSHMVVESLSRGKYVIWSQKYPYCYYSTDYISTVNYLNQLANVQDLNLEGINYIKNNLSQEIMASQFMKLYTNILSKET